MKVQAEQRGMVFSGLSWGSLGAATVFYVLSWPGTGRERIGPTSGSKGAGKARGIGRVADRAGSLACSRGPRHGLSRGSLAAVGRTTAPISSRRPSSKGLMRSSRMGGGASRIGGHRSLIRVKSGYSVHTGGRPSGSGAMRARARDRKLSIR